MKRTTILIASEDTQLTSQLAGHLMAPEHDFLFAQDRVSALLALREERPNLMLVDVALLGDAGEMIRFVRRTPQVSATGIIVLGPAFRQDEQIRFLDAGADDCLLLPVSKLELQARLHAVLRRVERWRQQTSSENQTNPSASAWLQPLQHPRRLCGSQQR